MYFAIILGIISFLNDVDGLRLYGGIDRMKWNDMDNTIRAIDYLSNPGYDYAIERCISGSFKNSRGSITLLCGEVSTTNVVTIGNSFFDIEKNRTRFFRTAFLEPHNPTHTIFGYHPLIFGDGVTGDIIITGALTTSYSDGQVYLYRGSNAFWTVQQTFAAPPQYYSDSISNYFGAESDFDEKFLNTFIVGCQQCSYRYDMQGSIYVYGKDSPKATYWSQKQILYTQQSTYGYLIQSPKIYDDTVTAFGFDATSQVSAAFTWIQDKKTMSWSQQQQLLTKSDPDNIVGVEVYGNTLVIATDEGYSSQLKVGQIYVYNASAPIPGPKGQPKLWKLVQIMRPPVAYQLQDFNYGMSLSLNSEWMVVTDAAANNYFYASKYGAWSLHQIFKLDVSTSTYNTQLQGNVFMHNGYNNIQTYTLDKYWDCVLVTMEDQWGDGWDTARLQIIKPNGDIDYYYPSCLTPNPYRFRYCPSSDEAQDSGLYKISITYTSAPKFAWEILYRVQSEYSEQEYIGDMYTQMNYYFDISKHAFIEVDIINDLSSNLTCIVCNATDTGFTKKYPKTKPTPISNSGPADTPNDKDDGKPYRDSVWGVYAGASQKEKTLSAHDHGSKPKTKTRAPTISPAPVVTPDDDFEYNIVTMTTDSEIDWFKSGYEGTFYYVSDINGQQLYAMNSMCTNVVTKKCYEEFYDGDYIIRVGGALRDSSLQSDFYWSFCGYQGIIQSQLTFKIRSGVCTALNLLQRNDFCDSLTTYLNVDIDLLFYGLDGVYSLSENEHIMLSKALANFLHLSSDQVNFKSLRHVQDISQNDALQMSFEVKWNVNELGFNSKDASSVLDASSYVENLFLSSEDALQEYFITNEFAGSALGGIHKVQYSDIVTFGLTRPPGYVDTHLKASFVISEESASLPYEEPPTLTDVLVEDYGSTVSTFGYIAGMCCIIFVIFQVVKKQVNKRKTLITSKGNITSMEKENDEEDEVVEVTLDYLSRNNEPKGITGPKDMTPHSSAVSKPTSGSINTNNNSASIRGNTSNSSTTSTTAAGKKAVW